MFFAIILGTNERSYRQYEKGTGGERSTYI